MNHDWMLSVLDDMLEYAELNDLTKTYQALSVARDAASADMGLPIGTTVPHPRVVTRYNNRGC